MSYDGQQFPCAKCGWSNFGIRHRCRNCGNPLRTPEAALKHARSDYDKIQEITTNDTTRKIPVDEPVFLIRGQDVVGAATVREWARLAEAAGSDPVIVQVARDHADKMDAWPKKKVADLPVPA